ncbi:hypothetical protein EMIT0232MI5_140132 [Pseudomonas sp. IT-232MI5]
MRASLTAECPLDAVLRSCTGYPERLRKQQSQVARHSNERSAECAVPNEDGKKHESSRVSG